MSLKPGDLVCTCRTVGTLEVWLAPEPGDIATVISVETPGTALVLTPRGLLGYVNANDVEDAPRGTTAI